MNTDFKLKVERIFAERLAKARFEAGFVDAEDFAVALGVSGHRYRHWEAARAQPSLEVLTRICQLLKVEPNDLLPLAVIGKKKKQKRNPSQDRDRGHAA